MGYGSSSVLAGARLLKISSNTSGTLLTVLKRCTHKVLVYGSISVHSDFYTKSFIIKIYRGISGICKKQLFLFQRS